MQNLSRAVCALLLLQACAKDGGDDTSAGATDTAPEALPAPLRAVETECGADTFTARVELDTPAGAVDLVLVPSMGGPESHLLAASDGGRTWTASLARDPSTMESGVSTRLDCADPSLGVSLVLYADDASVTGCFHRGAVVTEMVDALCEGESTPF
jgi:hypothetical protein